MKLVKVKPSFFALCKANGIDEKQLLQTKAGRPCVLIAKLRYKGDIRQFIIPLRSNIPGDTDKKEFFELPPNDKTAEGKYHGVHYNKLFPVSKKYIDQYRYDKSNYLNSIKELIDNNVKIIVNACQEYLTEYESGNRHRFTPDIDGIIEVLDTNDDK